MTSTSCADFEEINKNPYLPDKDMEQKDGVLNGAYMPNLEKHIIPVPFKTDNTDLTNAYQISINLCGDSWIGYFSPRGQQMERGVQHHYVLLFGRLGELDV